jgi:hypothetical protein
MRATHLLLLLFVLPAPSVAQSVVLHSGKQPEGWTNGLSHSKHAREMCFRLLHAIPNDAPGREYIRCLARDDQLVAEPTNGLDHFPDPNEPHPIVRDRPASAVVLSSERFGAARGAR